MLDAADPRWGPRGSRAAFVNVLDAAEEAGPATIVYVPAGLTVELETGLSLAGRTCAIHGNGGGMYAASSDKASGSVLLASAQSGPVLDFTGYRWPTSFRGRIRVLAGLAIVGSNAPDPTKANVGLRVSQAAGGVFRDLTITNTGGPCMQLMPVRAGSATYMCDFAHITLVRPNGADVHDVPYLLMEEANCNRLRDIGFMAYDSTKPPPANYVSGRSGVAVIRNSARYQSHLNTCDSWWFENVTVPDGGTIVSMAANENVVRDFQFIDSRKAPGATSTSFFALRNGAVSNYGGNRLETVVPGRGTGATNLDAGVVVEQPFNSIVGTKGYKGNNVVLAPGAHNTYVHLKGSQSGASSPGWVDDSGASTNHLVDEYLRLECRGGVTSSIATHVPQ